MIKILLPIICCCCVLGCSSTKRIVREVISADTIVLNDGTKVKYAGVEAPEKKSLWFNAAKAANEYLVLNHEVTLIEEPKLSQNGYITAYVYTPIKDSKEEKQLFVNAELVKFGYVRAAQNKVNVTNEKLWNNLHQIQDIEAKNYKVGIWSNQPPQE